MDTRRDILWRVHLVFLGVIILGGAVMGKVIYIQYVQGDHWKDLSDKQHLRYVDLEAERGTIYSEDGNMLSTSIPVFDIHIDFGADGLRQKRGARFYENLDSLSENLAGLFKDASAQQYKKKLLNGYTKRLRYYLLKRKISFEDYLVLREFPLIRQGRNRSGFIIEASDNRVNPYVLLANRTIGLSRGDTSKNVGLERSYDSVLRGEPGRRLMRYVAGAYMPVEGAEIAPVNGDDIVTTIDTRIQDIAENALLSMMEGNNSLHGTAIVMEVKTGKIKAIANLGKMEDGRYWEDYNYGLGRRTEPGSTFKLATLLSLLDDKYVDTNSLVDIDGGERRFYGLTIRDSHKGVGKVTVKEAFAMSSNVAFASLADKYYHDNPQKFVDHLKHYRLNRPSGIDIYGAAKPYLKEPSDKYWSKTTIPFMAHGYETLVTPLQMLMIYNAVANDGRMMKPYLVNSISELGNVVREFKPEVLVDRIAGKQTLAKAKECLLAVVESSHGTARELKSDYYQFGGKTGTAVSARDNRGYRVGGKIYQSAFMGFLPYDQPVYSIAVVIQNTRESRLVYGGSVAGPVFKEIADKIYASGIGSEPIGQFVKNEVPSLYRLQGQTADLNNLFDVLGYRVSAENKKQGWKVAYLNNREAEVMPNEKNILYKNVVPDVKGMGLNDAVWFLEKAGLKVSVMGKGRVAGQSLIAGTNFRRGETIHIELE